MSLISRNLFIFHFLSVTLCFTLARAGRFSIINNCSFTVWAGAVPGGGRELNAGGGTWSLDVGPGSTTGCIWPRTGCIFVGSGRGKCQTGDCGGLLQCQAYGAPPNTLAEYALNPYNNLDFFDISLVDGFNVPMEFSPTSNGCTRGVRCAADINGQCPNELKAPSGCNNPCTVFKTEQYCCNSGMVSCGPDMVVQILDACGVLCPPNFQNQNCYNSGSCGPTNYSRFFKLDRCPDAYSYPKDDQTSTFTCPTGTNYKVVFCP